MAMGRMHGDGAASAGAQRAGAEGFARTVSSSMGRVFRAGRLVFADRSEDAPAEARVHFVNWPDWCLSYYCRQVLRRDPIRGWLDSGTDVADGGVARLSDLVPGLRAARSRFPDERLGACGARHVLTIALRDDAKLVAAVSLVREASEGDFSEADCALARAMAPVLALAWRGAHSGLAQDAGPLDALTPREREVVALVADGFTNKAIARMLDASPWTVKNHLRAIFRKTGVANRTALCAQVRAGRS
jgi:DNA-binding CsgD family transcriptional regulator